MKKFYDDRRKVEVITVKVGVSPPSHRYMGLAVGFEIPNLPAQRLGAVLEARWSVQ
jgi:hypothetical protein